MDEWFGAFSFKAGATSLDEKFLTKLELGDMAAGVFGVKIEQAGVEVGITVSHKQMCGTELLGRAVLAAGGGLRKAAAALISRGG